MKVLTVASSAKPLNFEEELNLGQRYKLEYLELCQQLSGAYMDYDPPWMHRQEIIRRIEEKIHFDFYWAREIAKKVKREGFEVVISMSERIAVPLGYWLDKQVKHIAILINTTSPKWLLAMKGTGVYKKWDKIVTYSHAEAKALQSNLGIKPEKFRTILNYVDTDFFSPPQKNNSEPNDDPFIFSQGLAGRDYPTLIEAMKKLPHIDCDISAKSAWDNFKSGYEGLEIPSNVHIKSYDHPRIIRDVFSKCRFFVIPLGHPKKSMWCSGSTSVLQAQAMGKPVIATYLPGIAEYVKNNETGFVVEGNNPAALAEKIDYLWQNPEEAKAMGQRGQKWVRDNFSLKTWVDNMITLV